MTTLSFDPALIDATTRTERLPVTDVIEVSFRYPWAAGTAPAREWHTEVQHCLDLRHAGDSFAAVIDAARLIITENRGVLDLLPQFGIILGWCVIVYALAFRFFRWE